MTLLAPARPDVPPRHLRAHQATATTVGLAFAAYVVLERVAVPGADVALLLPLTLVLVAGAVWGGWVEVDRTRTVLWLVAVVATGGAGVVGSAVLPAPYASPLSWGLLALCWSPMVLRLRHRDRATFDLALRHVSTVGVVVAVACVLQMSLQWSGVPHVDLPALVLPEQALLQGFNTNNPLAYDSALVKANAFVGLEPSIVSFQLGVAALAAMLCGRRGAVAVIVVGIVLTFSGSGIIVLGAGLLILSVGRDRHLAVRQIPLLVAGLLVMWFTPAWGMVFGRAAEFGSPGSSGSLRAVEPYQAIYPFWRDDLWGIVLGKGPGASQQLVEALGTHGLIVTVPIKLFFDYGVLAGAAFALLVLVCHGGTYTPVLGGAIFVATWSIQPAATLTVLIGQLMLLVTFWSPRTDGPADGPGTVVPGPSPGAGRHRGGPRDRQGLSGAEVG